jgi:putative spermidine/putrescine transport system permease protein
VGSSDRLRVTVFGRSSVVSEAGVPIADDQVESAAAEARRAAARRRRSTAARGRALGGVVPFLAYATAFLLVPAVAVVVGAFQRPGGGLTTRNLSTAMHGVYLHGFLTSLKLSLIASVVPAAAGLAIALAVHGAPLDSVTRRLIVTASGVFANFGGVPLAFLFIATLGSTGLATGWLKHLGFDPYAHGFNLYGFAGVVIVYLYFQVPLMVLVVLPALEGLKPEWREAAGNLGASGWAYWRFVGGPVLFPSVLSCTLLLFGSAFSAYATANALTSGTVPLTSIQIGSFLNGNVLAGQENVGKALGFGMIVVIAVVMVGYALLQRRAARWSR